MTWALSFLIGNPLGRTLAKYAMIAMVFGLVVWMIYRKGQSDLKASQAIATLNSMRERIDVDHEIRSMSPDARRDALRRWVR